MTRLQWAFLSVLFVAGIVYVVWLSTGCNGMGKAMTWHGAVCVQSL